MDFKKILIAGVVIAGAWYLYNKSKKGSTTTTDESASGINGAQYLAEHGAFRNASGGYSTTCRCYGTQGENHTVQANCATQTNCCKAACSKAGFSDRPTATRTR